MSDMDDFLKNLGRNTYDDMTKRLGKEGMEELETDMTTAMEHYKDFCSNKTDTTDPLFIVAMLKRDFDTVIMLNLNSFMSGMLMYRRMMQALYPDAVKDLDRHNPDKFDAEKMQWGK